MKSTDIFTGLEEFREYADGLLADTTYQQLGPSIRSVTQEINDLITVDVYIALCNSEPDDALLSQGLEYLKSAVATGTLYCYAIFSSVKRNGSDASLYKYQYEEIKQHHSDTFWKSMDRLLGWLDSHASEVRWEESDGTTKTFADTDIYKERQQLPVRSAAEFDYYYGIDKSSYFFSKIQFLIRSVWKMKILPVIRGSKDETVLDLAKRSLCYQVMAKAIMQFDVTELPRSIRYDFNHEYTKGTSMQTRDKLYAQLMADVESWDASIQNILAAAAGSTAIQTNLNKEENKHYTML